LALNFKFDNHLKHRNMPIRKTQIKGPAPSSELVPTGGLSNIFDRPEPYQPIQEARPIPTPSWVNNIAAISTRDLNYFFNLAASIYDEGTQQTLASSNPVGGVNAPPGYGEQFQSSAIDPSAVLVIWLFRQTRIDIYPIAERFHLGPADRQPLYSLTAQPSIRSGTEFNELVIKRRDPIHGVWYDTCLSDIEPTLQLARPGNWTIAKLRLESMPVWKMVIAGRTVMEVRASKTGRGNTLCLSWGDRATIGCLGDAYSLWWETGVEGGMAEAFYICEQWGGFDKHPQGVIRVCLYLYQF
jgi:hypothetical protein